MKKRSSVGSLGKILGTIFVSSLVALPLQSKGAPTIEVISSKSNEGLLTTYDWAVNNTTPGYNSDNYLTKYDVQANLVRKGMTNFTNTISSGLGVPWDYVLEESFWELNGSGSIPIENQNIRTFSADVLTSDIIGEEQVGSYAQANSGNSNIEPITVPITRQMKTPQGVTYGSLVDQGINISNPNDSSTYDAAALADQDGDGYKNWEEIAWGSSPTDHNETPNEKVSITGKTLSLDTLVGRTYKIYERESLTSGDWQLAETYSGNGSTINHTTTNNLDSTFYKTEVQMD